MQNDPKRGSGGYVKLEFVENDYENVVDKKGKESRIKTGDWKDKVLDKLPQVMENIQDKGLFCIGYRYNCKVQPGGNRCAQ